MAEFGPYAAVASMAGAPTNPGWYHNMTASPLVELQDGAVRQDYTARELDGHERETWWARAVDAFESEWLHVTSPSSRSAPA